MTCKAGMALRSPVLGRDHNDHGLLFCGQVLKPPGTMAPPLPDVIALKEDASRA